MAESTTPAVLIEHGTVPTRTTPDTLRTLMLGFVAKYRAASTRKAYTEDLRQFFRWAEAHGVDPLVGVSRTHMELYARMMEDRGLAPATRQRRIGTVRGWYDWLTDEGYWTGANPVRKVKQPTVTTVRDLPYLTRVQTNVLLRAAREHSPRLGALVYLGLVNGLRIGEICKCNVTDLGEHGYYRTLRIVGKGDKHDTVPLEPAVAAQIDRATEGRTFGPLIVTREGTRMNRKAAAAMLTTVCRNNELPAMTPHALRRTAIILLLQAGRPIREVQLFARHANSKTTERYDLRVRSMEEHLSSVILREVA